MLGSPRSSNELDAVLSNLYSLSDAACGTSTETSVSVGDLLSALDIPTQSAPLSSRTDFLDSMGSRPAHSLVESTATTSRAVSQPSSSSPKRRKKKKSKSALLRKTLVPAQPMPSSVKSRPAQPMPTSVKGGSGLAAPLTKGSTLLRSNSSLSVAVGGAQARPGMQVASPSVGEGTSSGKRDSKRHHLVEGDTSVRTRDPSPNVDILFTTPGKKLQIPEAPGPRPSGQGEPRSSSSVVFAKGTSGRKGFGERHSTSHHSHSKVSWFSPSDVCHSEEEGTFPTRSAPCQAGAVEPSIVAQVVELEEQRNIFQKVISLIRRENNLKVPEPESSKTSTISGLEELWSGPSSESPPVHLPMSKMVMRMLQAVEFEVAGAANSLTSKRSSLLPPLSHKSQTHWYRLLKDRHLASPRRVSPEFADFVGHTPDKVASSSVAFSASELAFFDSLSSNILQATSWLDHGLVTVGKLLGSKISQDLKDLLISSAKSLQFLCNNAATLWVSLLLKKRDAALAMAPKFIPHKEKLELRNAKFLGSDLLFPREKVLKANKRKKAVAQSITNQDIELGVSASKHPRCSSPAPPTTPCPPSQPGKKEGGSA